MLSKEDVSLEEIDEVLEKIQSLDKKVKQAGEAVQGHPGISKISKQIRGMKKQVGKAVDPMINRNLTIAKGMKDDLKPGAKPGDKEYKSTKNAVHSSCSRAFSFTSKNVPLSAATLAMRSELLDWANEQKLDLTFQ